jgi:hypothetical protein
MASVLEPVVFDPATFRNELTDFEGLLKAKSDLSESDDIIPFFKDRKHLTAYASAKVPRMECPIRARIQPNCGLVLCAFRRRKDQ